MLNRNKIIQNPYFIGGYANAYILRTVAAMIKIKVYNHIYIERAF